MARKTSRTRLFLIQQCLAAIDVLVFVVFWVSTTIRLIKAAKKVALMCCLSLGIWCIGAVLALTTQP